MIIDGEWEKDVESSPVQEEPDFEAEEYWAHCDEAHDGNPCDCPPPTQAELDAAWAESARQHSEDEHDGGECDCKAPF